MQSLNLGTQISSKARSTYLWTERCAFLHAKSLNTDEAWDMYDNLIEYYFRTEQYSNNISAKSYKEAVRDLLMQLEENEVV